MADSQSFLLALGEFWDALLSDGYSMTIIATMKSAEKIFNQSIKNHTCISVVVMFIC